MEKDDRDILELLKAELAFIEKGGYGRYVRTPWLPKSAFQDSLTCINYGYLERAHPCSDCRLTNFIPTDRLSEEVPCHFIPITAAGETIADLEDNQPRLEANLKRWLREKITRIESERQSQAVNSLGG